MVGCTKGGGLDKGTWFVADGGIKGEIGSVFFNKLFISSYISSIVGCFIVIGGTTGLGASGVFGISFSETFNSAWVILGASFLTTSSFFGSFLACSPSITIILFNFIQPFFWYFLIISSTFNLGRFVFSQISSIVFLPSIKWITFASIIENFFLSIPSNLIGTLYAVFSTCLDFPFSNFISINLSI